jgi:hypothetical protein
MRLPGLRFSLRGPAQGPIWAIDARVFEKFTTKIRWVICDCKEEGFPL